MPNELSLDPSVYILFVWVFVLFMMYKISRTYWLIIFVLSVVQLIVLYQLFDGGYLPSTIQNVVLVAGVVFFLFGTYKAYGGLDL